MKLNEMLLRATLNNQENAEYLNKMSIIGKKEQIRQLRLRIRSEDRKLKELKADDNPDLLKQQQIFRVQNGLNALRSKYQTELMNLSSLERKQADLKHRRIQ